MDRKYPDIIDKIYKDNPKAKEVLLTHSFCVANEALAINKDMKLGLDEKFLYEAAMLHDIGIIGTHAPNIFCFGDKPYLAHGIIGASLIKGTEYEKYEDICKNHFGVGLNKEEVINLQLGTEAMEPKTIEEKLIAYADNFYSKKFLETLTTRLSEEDIINNLKRFGYEKIEKFYEFKEMFCKE